ncbi:MAG: acyltransferase [Pseudomonadota bacterium]|nr:acyltransferase [Pseudomonadota bacterium]
MATGTPQAPVRAIANLQILRLVAAAMVLFGHLNHEVLKKPVLAAGFVPFQPIWWHCGVDIFFVVSGFIMALITQDSFGKPGEAGRFLRARLIRLVPMYWLFTTLTLLAMALVPSEMRHHTTNWKHVLGSYLFVPLTMNADGNPRPVMILGWTLNYEMLFYVIFACAMRMGRRRGLAAIAVTLIALAAAGTIFTLPMPFKVWCDPIILEFLLGMLVYGLWRGCPALPAWAGLVIAGLGYLAMAAFMAAGIANHFGAYRVIWGGVPAAIIAAGVLMIREARAPGPIKHMFVTGGDASYALYLSHPFVLSAVALLCAKAGVVNAPLYIATAFAACLAFSALFYLRCEQPLQRLVRCRLSREPEQRQRHPVPAHG